MKSKILRHIKDNYNIYDNIADSETIQYLLNFLCQVFSNLKKKPNFNDSSWRYYFKKIQ